MTKLLLDTNVAVWLLIGDRGAVTERAGAALQDEANQISVSAVTYWEIAIKRSLGKLELEDGWSEALTRLRFEPLPINARHAERVETLPWHHRDPFDRLLIAQAELEDHSLVSADSRFDRYEVGVLW